MNDQDYLLGFILGATVLAKLLLQKVPLEMLERAAVAVAWARHVARDDLEATVRRVRGALALLTVRVSDVVGVFFLELNSPRCQPSVNSSLLIRPAYLVDRDGPSGKLGTHQSQIFLHRQANTFKIENSQLRWREEPVDISGRVPPHLSRRARIASGHDVSNGDSA